MHIVFHTLFGMDMLPLVVLQDYKGRKWVVGSDKQLDGRVCQVVFHGYRQAVQTNRLRLFWG
jgi:hypothetical protein